MTKQDRWGYAFILPFFAAFAVFTAFPIVNTFIVSLTDETMTTFESNFIFLENYAAELTQPLFWKSFLNTWIIWLPNIIAQISIALFLAWALTNRRLRIKGTGAFKAIYFFPNLVPVASIAILAYALFDWQSGPINQLLFGTGAAAKDRYIWWFNSPRLSQVIVSSIQTWMWFGYTMTMFVAGVLAIPQTLFEAAIIDGANEWQVFRRITLPNLKPIMQYVLITSLIGGMQMFDLPWILTQGSGLAPGGVENSLTTMMVYMYSRAFSWDQNLGGASAVSWLLFIFVAAVSFLYLRLTREKNAEGGSL